MDPTPAAYPATIAVATPEKIANWRPLVHWLLAIPHWIVASVLGVVAEVVSLVAWFAIVFTGKLPEGLAGVMALSIRANARAMTYAGFLYEEYPPFAFTPSAADPGDFAPVRVDLTPALEGRNRLTVAFRTIWLIPHAIVVSIVYLVAFVAWFIGFFAVLFTGRWPDGLRTFIMGSLRWGTRVQAYALLLTDEYPPFSMD